MLLPENGQFAVADPADFGDGAASVVLERNCRMISHGDSLFTPGSPRHAAYRVESGALCHYVVWPDGTHDVIEFAFPGDIVGLGSLGEHVSTAQAIVDTLVAPVSGDELDQALAADAALANRMATTTDLEFDYLRQRALQPGLRPVVNRVAAYLLAVAGAACRSGDTHLATGPNGISSLASVLDVSSEKVSTAISTLKDGGLIVDRDDTIIILDRDGLEDLADA
jgi:CRP/FNR family transcriptional regulator